MSNPTYALALLLEHQREAERIEALRQALIKALDAFTAQCDQAIARIEKAKA